MKIMSYNLLDLAVDKLTGNVLYVTQETLKHRIGICKSCEFLISPIINKSSTGTCGKCGCFLDSKATYTKSECPTNKWKEGNI